MRRVQRTKLIDHIDSDYISATHRVSASAPVMVYVEGYDDIAFWRGVFDNLEDGGGRRRFEITTPARSDLAKGKKVVLSFASKAGKSLLLCVDSDFDYLFGNHSVQSKVVNNSPFVIQTYVYAIENLLCLPSSLDTLATRIARNDAMIFNFEVFCEGYSAAIFPLFVWYYYTARSNKTEILTLTNFKNSVKLNFLDMGSGGAATIRYIERQVAKKVEYLEGRYNDLVPLVEQCRVSLELRGVSPGQTHLWVQGHFWQDNVVKVILATICNKLREMTMEQISNSTQNPLTKRNTISSYNNALREIDAVIRDNTIYQHTSYYGPIIERIRAALST